MTFTETVVRFAPSPTGMFHVGSARTALFNWLWAKHTGGRFLLRIEDTDAARSTTESRDEILSSMRRLGLDWDGDVYYSSEHAAEHRLAALTLIEKGLAYYCNCSREDIDARGITVKMGYDGFCRDKSVSAEGSVVRLRNPGGVVSFTDLVVGSISVPADTLGDFPLVKSDGQPLFLLGNVLDDTNQGVTCVIRGADHLSNNAKYILIWKALQNTGTVSAELPEFAHLPLIVGPGGKKLSKRRDKVDMGLYLDQMGVLPSAMLTYLSGLGWGAPDGHDKDYVADLVEVFSLSSIVSNNALFDSDKLRAVNFEHIQRAYAESPEVFANTVRTYLQEDWDLLSTPDTLADLPSRITLLSEVRALLLPIFADAEMDEKSKAKWLTKNPLAKELLEGFVRETANLSWDTQILHDFGVEFAAKRGLGLMKATMPLRVAILRNATGMPLFSSLVGMGRATAYARMEELISTLS